MPLRTVAWQICSSVFGKMQEVVLRQKLEIFYGISDSNCFVLSLDLFWIWAWWQPSEAKCSEKIQGAREPVTRSSFSRWCQGKIAWKRDTHRGNIELGPNTGHASKYRLELFGRNNKKWKSFFFGEFCRITQQGLRCGFENTSDKGQFQFKHI